MTPKERARQNIGLVFHVLKKNELLSKMARDRGIATDDLVQAGFEGLIKSAEKYKPELGYAFSTYACEYIRGFMQKEIHRSSSYEKNLAKGNQIYFNKIDDYNEDKPDNYRLKLMPQELTSEGTFRQTEASLMLEGITSCLSKKERYILLEVYGKERTHGEVAADFGLSRQRIDQICKQAMGKLREKRST